MVTCSSSGEVSMITSSSGLHASFFTYSMVVESLKWSFLVVSILVGDYDHLLFIHLPKAVYLILLGDGLVT